MARVRLACRRLRLAGNRLLLAVSGGADSVAMLLAFHELSEEFGIRLEVATFDHGLRPGSADDVVWVRRLCDQLGIRCHAETLQIAARGNREAAARRARYAALRRLAGSGALIATAHTREDQVETVLLRLARGTGTRGLRGVRERRGSIVRPMLAVSRAEVRALLRERGVEPREDPTNASLAFARNRVRHLVLPVLIEALGPACLDAIARSAAVAAQDERYLARRAASASRGLFSRFDEERVDGDVRRLARLPAALRARVLRRAARAVGCSPSSTNLDAMTRALASPGPRRIDLPDGVRMRVRYGLFSLERAPADEAAPAPFDYVVPGPGRFELGTATVEVGEAGLRPGSVGAGMMIDPARLSLPLHLRSRRPGDRFRPRGGRTRKLKAFLIDRKVAREQRDELLLLTDSAGRVLWVVGVCESDAALEGAAADAPWQVQIVPRPSAAGTTRLELPESGGGRAAKRGGTLQRNRGITLRRKGK